MVDALGDVADGPCHARRVALLVPFDDATAVEDVDDRAVPPDHAVLVLVGAGAGERLLQRALHVDAVVLVQQGREDVDRVLELARLEAEELAPLRVVRDDVADDVPVPDAVAGGLHRIGVAPLALLDLLIGALEVGDVVGDDEDAGAAVRPQDRLLDGLEDALLTGLDIGGGLHHGLGGAAADDVAHVLEVEGDLIGVGVERTVVVADESLGGGAVEPGEGAVAEQESAVPVLHEDDVRSLVDHRPEEVLGVRGTRPRIRGRSGIGRRRPLCAAHEAPQGPPAVPRLDRRGVEGMAEGAPAIVTGHAVEPPFRSRRCCGRSLASLGTRSRRPRGGGAGPRPPARRRR